MNKIPSEARCHNCPCWYVDAEEVYRCNLYGKPIGKSLLNRLPQCLADRPQIVATKVTGTTTDGHLWPYCGKCGRRHNPMLITGCPE